MNDEPTWRQRLQTPWGRLAVALLAIGLGWVVSWSVLVVVLCGWMMLGLAAMVTRSLELSMLWQGVRLRVPVLVIESDDWGAGFIVGDGPTVADDLDARQARGIEQLTEALSMTDGAGGRPVVGAFVVTGAVDVPATVDDPEGRWHSVPIDRAMPRTTATLNELVEAGRVSLHYHGRDHVSAEVFARELRRQARGQNRSGGEVTLDEVRQLERCDDVARQNAVMNEYFTEADGTMQPLSPEVMKRKVNEGLLRFERAFGCRPSGTAAPRHIWGDHVPSVWHEAGLVHLHGVNRQLDPVHPRHDRRFRRLGSDAAAPLVGVPRNIFVEFDGDESTWPAMDRCLAEADRLVAAGRPVVVSTHACNFDTPEEGVRQRAIGFLVDFVSALGKRHPGLRFVSSDWLGGVAAGGSDDYRLVVCGPLGKVVCWWRDVCGVLPKLTSWQTVLGALVLAVVVSILRQAGL